MTLVDDMRPADAAECRAGGFSPDVMLDLSIQRSDASYDVYSGRERLAVWGWKCLSFVSSSAVVWCLSFEAADRHKVFFARESRRLLAQILTRFRYVHCEVSVEHKAAIRWLIWLGFRFERISHHGPNRAPFYVMLRERG